MNGVLYRRARAPKTAETKVHLGPGQKNYLRNWLNIDANMFTAKCDVWTDLRNPLPLREKTVKCFYSHHVIEHLPNLKAHFADAFRCLRPGGVYRVGGPNGDSAIEAFVKGDAEWFSDFPDRRNSIGGRFENFIFCRQEHLTILTESYLREILDSTGFVDVTKHAPVTSTSYPELFGDCMALEYESTPDRPHTLILECVRPE